MGRSPEIKWTEVYASAGPGGSDDRRRVCKDGGQGRNRTADTGIFSPYE